jgi:exopolyphosphatase/pppGpp-phosphohydrolase
MTFLSLSGKKRLNLFLVSDSFEQSEEDETCSLDLGGGSTQVTFVPSNEVHFCLFKKYRLILN